MVIPAIIPKSLEHLTGELEKVSFAPKIQIDVVDGKFVPFTSWPYKPAGKVEDIAEILEDKDFEVDLMVKDQGEAAKEWLSIGASAIIFHLEGLDKAERAFDLRKEFKFDLALSISNDTPLEELYPYMDKVDYIQLMGIKDIGQQSQPFDDRVLERVITLSSLYPNTPVSIDGGVSESTIQNLKTAGASRFVSGSAILNSSDPKAEYQKLLKIISD